MDKEQTKPAVSQAMLDLYDAYTHGAMSRRVFMEQLSQYAVAGVTVAALAEALLPNYAEAQQVREDDTRIVGETVTYPSPNGAGTMSGYLVTPSETAGRLGGVVVIHENRGLNPHIADVARRVAAAGYVAFAPDALFPLGGYPGNDDDGRKLQRQRDRAEMLEDFIAAAAFLKRHPKCTGTVGCVGFCFGGAIANYMAVRIPDLAGAVPFYGGWPRAEEAAMIKAPLLIHLGGRDQRVNAGWPAYETALKANNVSYEVHIYEGANHGFHNDTTPRYDKTAAKLAWSRTLDFFQKYVRTA